jgi:predicted dehydrogenase
MYTKCAIIGFGDFSRNAILPAVKATGRFKIKYVVVRSDCRAKALRESNDCSGIEFVSSYEDVLLDPSLDCVFIATRHDQHKQQILQAINAGKAVFTEKPMAMTYSDAECIAEHVKRKNGKLMIGLNRRFAPFSVRIKDILSKLEAPFLINYRWINKAWDSNWPFDPVQGGGKLVSSGCHMLDLIMYLLGDAPESVSASLKTMIKSGIKTHDSASVSLNFRDGSSVNICTSELGAAAYPQELLEIFTKEGVIVLDNFKKLSFYDFDIGDILYEEQDKGIHEEMVAFADYIEGKLDESPCGTRDGLNVARCTEACIKSSKDGCRISLKDIQ